MLETAILPLGLVTSTAPFVLYSSATGLLSEYQSATQAVRDYVLFVTHHGEASGKQVHILHRTDRGWERF